MPGANCALYGCSTSRKSNLSLFQIPSPAGGDGEHTVALKNNARKEWLHVILRTIEMTPDLKNRIKAKNIYLCELHFKADSIIQNPKRKYLETGSVPTENLPKKSHEKKESVRRPLVRHVDMPSTSTVPPRPVDKEDFEEFSLKIKETNLHPWCLGICGNEELRIELRDENYSIPKYALVVNSCLQFSVFNWMLPDHHPIYTAYRRNVSFVGIPELLQSIEQSFVCEGLRQDEYVSSIAKDPENASHETLNVDDVVRHSVPKEIDFENNYSVSVVLRCSECLVLVKEAGDQARCDPCKALEKKIDAQTTRKRRRSATPAKNKAPLAACGPEKLRATVITTRLRCKELECKVNNLQAQIEKHAVCVSEPLN